MIKATSLDIGCGKRCRPGWVGVDLVPHEGIQVCRNAWEVGQYVEPGVLEIHSRHMLEHLTLKQARMTLEAWFKILRPGGEVEILVPDLTFHVKQYLGKETRTHDPRVTPMDHAMAGLYGWQDGPHDVHKWGWNVLTLTRELKRAGFIDIERQENDPWHLHMKARKPR